MNDLNKNKTSIKIVLMKTEENPVHSKSDRVLQLPMAVQWTRVYNWYFGIGLPYRFYGL